MTKPSIVDNCDDTNNFGNHQNSKLTLTEITKSVGKNNDFNCTQLKFIHTNCQSAMNKKGEIRELIDNHSPLVIGLTEFGAPSHIKDGELNTPDYSLYRGDHSSGEGGLGKGTALYVHDSLNHSACPSMEETNFDCTAWCQIRTCDDDIILVGVIYRSPNSPPQNNDNLSNRNV